MDIYIYRLIRDMESTKAPISNVAKEELNKLSFDESKLFGIGEASGETAVMTLAAVKGKGGKKGGGKGAPNFNGYGKGLCFECGKPGHFPANCFDKPKGSSKGGKDGKGKGKGRKGGKGGPIRSLQDMFAFVDL